MTIKYLESLDIQRLSIFILEILHKLDDEVHR